LICSSWAWDLNSGLHDCKADTLQLKPHLQSCVGYVQHRGFTFSQASPNHNPPVVLPCIGACHQA
jgi:hypothetical protein